jgi:hypothetical protein
MRVALAIRIVKLLALLRHQFLRQRWSKNQPGANEILLDASAMSIRLTQPGKVPLSSATPHRSSQSTAIRMRMRGPANSQSSTGNSGC